jgi:hypothetical protein
MAIVEYYFEPNKEKLNQTGNLLKHQKKKENSV